MLEFEIEHRTDEGFVFGEFSSYKISITMLFHQQHVPKVGPFRHDFSVSWFPRLSNLGVLRRRCDGLMSKNMLLYLACRRAERSS